MMSKRRSRVSFQRPAVNDAQVLPRSGREISAVSFPVIRFAIQLESNMG
jgi:hypothetical protein